MTNHPIFSTEFGHAADPPEPPRECRRDALYDRLDTLRHERFALQNSLFKAPPKKSAALKRLLGANKAERYALQSLLEQQADDLNIPGEEEPP